MPRSFFSIKIIPILIFTFSHGKENPIDPSKLEYKIANATRIHSPIIIDGYLDEDAWKNKLTITDFLQWDPDNLEKPTKQTEVIILYDEKYIYAGFRSFQKKETIRPILARRDAWMDAAGTKADWVAIGIDSQNDDLNASLFVVNSAGVQIDVLLSMDNNISMAWDAVWKSDISIHDDYWIAEIRIPLSILSYKDTENQTWGLVLHRASSYNNEWVQWPGSKRGARGIVSRYGILEGIQNIPIPKLWEIQPYVLGGAIEEKNTKKISNIGMDIIYPINSNTRVSATFNPDFGQVEADPSVLNLTAFETFFEERRPFYVKGARFFTGGGEFGEWNKRGEGSFITQPILLFNSRRIGREPQAIDPGEGQIIQQPSQTQIIGAAKIFGKTQNNTSFGVLTSITANESATIEIESDNGQITKKELIEPQTQYMVGRLERPLINDLSTVGLMVTHVAPQTLTPYTTGAMDWRFKFFEKRFTFGGQIAHSSANAQNGYAGRIDIRYDNTKWWDVVFKAGYYDEKFDINRLGYIRRNGVQGFTVAGGLQRRDPWGIFRQNFLNLSYFNYGRLDGTTLVEEIELEQRNTFKNYWTMNWGFARAMQVYNDGDTFRDSDAWIIRRPAGWRTSLKIGSDPKLKISGNVTAINETYDSGSGMNTLNVSMNLRPTNSMKVSLISTYAKTHLEEQWVKMQTNSNNKKERIYATSTQLVKDYRIRLDYLFNTRLSFQAYLQPFEADVNYNNYKVLARPRSFEFIDTDYMNNNDFISRRTNGTFVFRWEYAPGSRLFLVYNLDQTHFFQDSEGIWTELQTNSLFIKLDYFFRR